MKKILIIGSTGMLGKPVTKELISAGFDVTVLVRDIEKATSLFPGVKAVKGDVFDKSSLLVAMEGIDIVYINLSVIQTSTKNSQQPEREGVDNIIAAAKEKGLKRLSYLSSLVKNYQGMNGFRWWAFEIKQSAVNKIKSSGIPYTIFYPSTFMETFPFQMIKGNKIMMLGHSLKPMWFIAASDYAKQVVLAMRQDGSASKEYNVQGPDAFTFDEAADVIMSHYPKGNLKVMKAPLGIVKFLGRFMPRLQYGANICEALNKYPEKFESENTWRDLGRPTVTLKDYAASL
jgi:uncharacterized protein YbjT (DUF2867 family)